MWILDMLKKKADSPDAAVISREQLLTYSQLWSQSETAARYILERCRTRNPVLIYGNKELEITVLMIACLKTGRAYVPLDITYPRERVRHICQDVEAELVFNCSEVSLEMDNEVQIIEREEIRKILQRPCQKEVPSGKYVKEEDNCYILFTSGSTGKAKGVQINRRNIENFVGWFSNECLEDNENDIVMNQVSYSFDVSVIPLYIFLGAGKCLFSIDKEMLDHTKLLFEYLRKSGINVWVSTPTFLEMCCFDDSFNEDLLPGLRKIILAGEILTKQLVSQLNEKFPKAQVINGYGPTEGTVLLSSCVITSDMMKDEKMLPIGKVLPDGEYKIVDDEGNVVKEGETGELIISSKSISKGYFKNPEQTQKVFFEVDGKQWYRTGDLIFEEAGLLYYVSRKDTQIKLNGYRIELNDISENLNALEMISNSVVLPSWKDGRVSFLTAFVTLLSRDEGKSDLKVGIEIKKRLRLRVPSYMVPKKIVILDHFPMNINGKIDRKKLEEEYL